MKSAVRACGLILFGLVVALVPIEIGLRIAGVGGPAELDSTFDRSSRGFIPHPDRQNPWVTEGGDTLRVAVIGDSFTTGSSNQWYDAYPRRLERLLNLNADAVPAEVLVYARNGISTWQQLRFLEEAIEAEPDLIILGLFINDTENGQDPKVAEGLQEMLPRVPEGWKLKLLRASRTLGWIYLRLENVRRYRAALDHQEYVFDPEYSGFKRFERAIKKFVVRTRKNDIPLIGVIWPSMGGLGPGYPHKLAHERLRQVLDQAKMPNLDLLGEFEDKSSLRLSAYPDIDVHPNEIGHRIGATAIFEYLLKTGQIDNSYRPNHNRIGGPGYWLRRVRRKRSPLYPLTPSPKKAPARDSAKDSR